jgi:hypothetical protein
MGSPGGAVRSSDLVQATKQTHNKSALPFFLIGSIEDEGVHPLPIDQLLPRHKYLQFPPHSLINPPPIFNNAYDPIPLEPAQQHLPQNMEFLDLCARGGEDEGGDGFGDGWVGRGCRRGMGRVEEGEAGEEEFGVEREELKELNVWRRRRVSWRGRDDGRGKGRDRGRTDLFRNEDFRSDFGGL